MPFRELISETRWSREYRAGPRGLAYESKLSKEGLEVSAALIREQWAHWSLPEQFDFARAFMAKAELSSEDQQILAFLMEAGSELVWGTIACLLPGYSDRERALAFLLERVASGGRGGANYYQALGVMGDARAIPLLRQASRKHQEALPPLEDQTVWDLGDYLSCLDALWKLEGPGPYEPVLRELLSHPDEEVREAAQRHIAERKLQDRPWPPSRHEAGIGPPGEDRELAGEMEWSKVYRYRTGYCWYVSKFLTGAVEVTATSIRQRWPGWALEEQVEFARAFCQKPAFTAQDREILAFLIEEGREYIRTMAACPLANHADLDSILSFFRERIRAGPARVENYFEALRRIGDGRAVPFLRERYEAYRKELAPLEQRGGGELKGYMRCCRTLWMLTGAAEYKVSLEEMLRHPDPAVQRQARRLLPPQRS